MNDRIDDLVNDMAPVRPRRPSRLAAMIVLPALLLSLAFMGLAIGLRPDFTAALGTAIFWIKLCSMAAIAAAGWIALASVARPDGTARGGLMIGLGFAALLVVVGGINLVLADPAARTEVLMGHSVEFCLPRVTLIALPVFAASLLLLRRMAPAHLRAAGFAAGLFAGAAGAAVYSLTCAEESLTFLAIWYQLPMLALAALGALLGPRLLRW